MEEKKEKRIGTVTFGIVLIVIGISILISMIAGVNSIRLLLYGWPAVLISLGVEILYYNSRKEIKIKYDLWGMFLTGCLLLFSFGVGIACFFLNDVVFSNRNYNKLVDKVSNELYEDLGIENPNDMDEIIYEERIPDEEK